MEEHIKKTAEEAGEEFMTLTKEQYHALKKLGYRVWKGKIMPTLKSSEATGAAIGATIEGTVRAGKWSKDGVVGWFKGVSKGYRSVRPKDDDDKVKIDVSKASEEMKQMLKDVIGKL
jgi:hypothetical protein